LNVIIRLKNKKGILVLILLSTLLIGCAENKILIKKKSQALEDLGKSRILQGHLREGLEKLLEASRLDPENANIHNELGLVYRNLGVYEKSIVHFKRALALRAEFPEAQNNLGTVYGLLKEWDLAIDRFQMAASDILYKTPHIAYDNMGLAYYNKGNYQKAIENYQKALRFFPSYSRCYENLARAYEAINSFQAAIESYNKSITYSPDYPTPHFSLARLYIRLNRKGEAAKELMLTMEIDPDGPYGNEAKRLLEGME
jgi:tetratricopeptide (TPR) repeat protein